VIRSARAESRRPDEHCERLMWASFGWGTLAASTLVIGAVLAILFHIRLRWIGLIMAFGAGVLISAVAFDLVEEAQKTAPANWPIYLGIFAGCGVFFGGDWLIDRAGGSKRKDPAGAQQDGSALAIVLGSVLDGIPESMVIGLTIFAGGKVGAAYLAAVLISNLPESISSTSGLITGRWTTSRILWMWSGITLISGLASLAGYSLFQHSSPNTVAFVLTFAAGAILTMLADTMMPEAYVHGGKLVGVVTTLGFATALLIGTLD
jgi:zinc transporter, ZIP family